MSGSIEFSIIVPIRNIGNTLAEFRRFVNSIFGQTFSDWELVVVDNASTDHTATVLAEYANGNQRIRIHRNESVQPEGIARNNGAAIARGKYVLYSAHQDYLFPDALMSLHDLIETLDSPEIIQFISLTAPSATFAPDSAQPVPDAQERKYETAHYLTTSLILRHYLYGNFSSHSWGKAIKTGLAREIKFEPGFPEDIPRMLRLCAHALTAVRLQKCLYFRALESEAFPATMSGKEVFCNHLDRFSRCQEILIRYHTKELLPTSHRVYCMWWLLLCSDLLAGFKYSDKEIRAWGDMLNDAPLKCSSVLLYLCHGLWRGNFLSACRQIFRARSHYKARRTLPARD